MFPKRNGSSASRHAGRLLLVVAGCAFGALAPAGAQAAVDLSVRAPSIAGGLTLPVGQTAEGQIDVTNGTTAPEWVKPFIIKQITLLPSCGAAAADPQCKVAPGPDTGVITIADTATGSGACSGTIFDVAVIDALTGRVSFTPSPEISLSANGAGATCTITFTYTVQHMPTKDSGSAPGWQTDLVAYASGYVEYQGQQITADDPGTTKVTVVRDTPELVTRAPQTVTLGGDLSASGTLTAAHPTGTVRFDLFGPTDVGCAGVPMSSSPINLTGTTTGRITYRPPVVPATQTGTYHWTTSYSGDANNDAASSPCNESAATLVSPPSSSPPLPQPATVPGATTSGDGGTTPGGSTIAGAGSGNGGHTTAPPVIGVGKRVRLDRFALTRRTFARASSSTALAVTAAYVPKKQRKAAKKGTTITYTLSGPATVTIVVERVLRGRRASANTCVKATTKLKRKKACTRYATVSTLKRVHTTAGAKKVAFSGRAGRKFMPLGRYRMRAVAIAGVGTGSAERRTTFKIVK
jgi:hypothetical protein